LITAARIGPSLSPDFSSDFSSDYFDMPNRLCRARRPT
jgi:hypothetical protein